MQHALKKSLSYTWAKASDLKETYEFKFSGKDLACVRSNAGGDRRFRLSFDAEVNRLWWGESYFLDPNDLKDTPDRAKWYRASDNAKRHVAFTWHRREARPLPPEAFAPAQRSSAKAPPPASSAPQPKGKAVPRILTKASANAPPSKAAPAAKESREPKEPRERPVRLREGRVLPEVILDLREVFVVYKPAHWRCELPSKDALQEEPEAGRGQRDPLLLLRWIREKLPTIEPELFEEDFNPALSGTGFGPLSHRIDQETSGPMLVARTKHAQRHLKSQFHKTEVSKRYLCLVHGRVSKPSGVIDANIRTYRTDSLTLSEVASSGEWAYTAYQVVATYGPLRGTGQGGFTLVACEIKTGRTHQIRVHMQHLGHSLVSDDKYLSEERLSQDRTWCPRLFLHCYRLGFRDMEGDFETVVCPLPQDLKSALLRLGAADPAGLSSDTLFSDTSWQRELFRPPLSHWQPSTQALRRAVALLSASPGPLSLAELGADAELRRLLAEEEGASSPSRAWLSKHWRCFEATSRQAEGGGSELCVRLRPAHAAGDGDEEHDLERRIEAVRSELEELQRQKQRAVAEEEYQRAAEIKKRLEASHAELDSLLSFAELEGDDGSLGGPRAGGPDRDFGADRERRGRRGPEPVQREAFKQDVRDEALFPSLIPSKHPPKRLGASSLGPTARAGAAAAPAANRAASASHHSAAAAPAASAAAAAGSAAAAAATAQEEEEQEAVLGLKEALLEFLQKREGSVAHINEVNNDKFLRQVMAAQLPKPVAAVNKAWLKQHEDFALLRTEENEMYVAISHVVKAKAKAAAARAAAAVPKNPAYHQVIQKTAAGDAAPPLRYSYNAATRKEDASAAKASEPGGNSVAVSWQDKFLAALREVPQKSRSAEELLQCVPLFAEAMGTRKLLEQKELLVLFLEGFPDIFKVEKRGSGADRQYVVWAR